MLKKISVLILLITAGLIAKGQSADSVYSKYLDFNLARFQGETDKAKELGESLVPLADKLPEKARTNFYFAVGKMYEDADEREKALPYYEKVAAAVPDYYVVHRGLGYIYLWQAKELKNKIYTATDAAQKKQLTEAYTKAARLALPHLEKAQACDPSDETLDEIKALYQNLKDDQGLKTLDERLKRLDQHCIDLLPDN